MKRKNVQKAQIVNERGNYIMDIGMLLIVILMALLGGGSCIYIVISMFGILGKKIYRKIRLPEKISTWTKKKTV
jgi:hypothetical protein